MTEIQPDFAAIENMDDLALLMARARTSLSSFHMRFYWSDSCLEMSTVRYVKDRWSLARCLSVEKANGRTIYASTGPHRIKN